MLTSKPECKNAWAYFYSQIPFRHFLCIYIEILYVNYKRVDNNVFFNSFSKIKIFFLSVKSFYSLNIAFGQKYKHFMTCY